MGPLDATDASDATRVGLVDCHFHVIGPQERFPMVPGRSYTPATAALDEWLGGTEANPEPKPVVLPRFELMHSIELSVVLTTLGIVSARAMGMVTARPTPAVAASPLKSIQSQANMPKATSGRA